jgi:hypothetical protein
LPALGDRRFFLALFPSFHPSHPRKRTVPDKAQWKRHKAQGTRHKEELKDSRFKGWIIIGKLIKKQELKRKKVF